jgi:shikimate kinase
MRNLILTGFMGTGKTTVGRLCAEALNFAFVDTDTIVIRRAGLSIPEIFAQHGEAEFRRIEREVCLELAAGQGQVIATGGGALINSETRDAMAEGNLLICLTAHSDIIRKRLADPSGRPLAKDWETLYEKRRDAYAAMPHQVDTTNKRPEAVVKEIVRLWAESQLQ